MTEDLEQHDLLICRVDQNNREVFDRLMQCYECEFSRITEKKPGQDGLFSLDTDLDDAHHGFVFMVDSCPCGLAVVGLHGNNSHEICEFFIVPSFRRASLGTQAACRLFSMYPGDWQVKQIAGADSAILFWQEAINRFAKGNYRQDVYEDPYWGTVTRQMFVSNGE